jgi:hypothetical protein
MLDQGRPLRVQEVATEPESRRAWTVQTQLVARVAVFVAVAAVLVLVFQLFFRYQYIHTVGVLVMRVDRLTGSSCFMPCDGSKTMPAATATPWLPTDEEKQQAIQLAKSMASVNSTFGEHRENKWSAEASTSAIPISGWSKPPTEPEEHTYLVCFCNGGGRGFRWEVHVDTNRVYYVNDNADLMSKYGLK